MLRRWLVGGCLTLLAAAGCSSSSESVSLEISPGGTVQASGPTSFTARVQGSTETPTWSLAGPGSLSGTSGTHVVYTPPVDLPADPHATLSASIPGASASVQLDLGVVTSGTIPGLTADVTVKYDSKQVPHIECEQANDCLAVEGYLHARDRLFQMDFMRRLARGRLSELVGPAALSQDVQLRTLFTTRDGRRLEDALADVIDPITKPKVEAYVNGINAYLATLKGNPSASLPGEYAQLPYPITAADIPDWTLADVTALARLQQFELSESLGEEMEYGQFAAAYGPGAPLADAGKMNAWIRSAQPVGAQAHTLDTLASTLAPGRAAATAPVRKGKTSKAAKAKVQSAPPVPPLVASRSDLSALAVKLASLERTLRPLDGSVGSNNWVVDAAHSANGQAMVANDPHLSLQYPPNFYLSALTSSNPADNLDITGGAFPGVPGALVGRGKNVGWGVTVVGYDVTDIYVEQAVTCPAGTPAVIPFCTSFNGGVIPVLPVAATWMVRVGPGAEGLVDAQALADAGKLPESQRPPRGIAIVPPHGPIIQAPPSVPGTAYSVRWTGQESWTQDLRAFLGLDTATNVDTAMAALDDYATGAQNFVLADDAGHIAYYPHALVPVRKFADPYTVGPANVKPPWFPLPGDGSAEWGTGNPDDHCDGLDYTKTPPAPAVPAAACWIPKDKLPQGKDSAVGFQGFFATANSDPTKVSDSNNPLATQPYLSFDWGDPTGLRITRIVQLMQAKLEAGGGKVSLADMEAIQSDHVSLIGQLFADILASSAFDTAATDNAEFKTARDMLTGWAQQSGGPNCPTGLEGVDPASSPADPDPTVTADSAACYLFHAFLRDLITNVFTDDLKVAGLGVSGGPAVRGILYMLQAGTPDTDTKFCNDVNSSGTQTAAHSCGDQVVTALVQAYRTLSGTLGDTSNWRWGRVHTMQPVSLFPLVTTGYEPGPYARPGGAFTVDVGNPSLSGGSKSFSFNSSGNVRHISVMDPSSPVVKMQLPGPERDLPFGVVEGPDLLGEWVRNQYFDYATSSQIDAAAVASQTFKAP